MSGRIRMVMAIMGGVALLSIISFVLLVKFYPPLRFSLFGGKVPISINDIHFWVEKAPHKDYCRIRAKYIKNLETVMEWGHTVFFADNRGPLGFDSLFFNPQDDKIYGGGLKVR